MRTTILFCSLAMLFCSGVAQASDVNVTWQSPEKFTDIRPANDSPKRYQEHVTAKLDAVFNELAAQLPEGYKWHVTVTDLDLAGDVDHFMMQNGQNVRVVKDIYSPAIKFSHELVNAQGQVIASGDESVRDMSFMSGLKSQHSIDELHYERVMLENWFKKTLLPLVTK